MTIQPKKFIPAIRNIKTFSSFKSGVYRLYYGGMLGQMASMNMQQIAGGLLLERLTNSPAIVGMMALANAIPMLILSLFGGVIADRVEKKYVLLWGQAAFALGSLGIAISLNTGYLSPEHEGSWWILIVSSAFQGSIMGLVMPSRQSIINDIVPGKLLMNAISLNFMGMNALQLLAPAVAGFMVDAFDFKTVYYTMTVIYVVAVFFFFAMPRTGIQAARKSSALAGIKEGLDYVWQQKTIRLVLFLSVLSVVLSMPYSTLMPFFADKILFVGARGMGVLMSVSGAGAITASITLASIPSRKRGITMLIAGLFLGITLTGFAFSTSWPLSLVLIALVGIGSTIRMTLTNTLIQYYVANDYRGRVMSLFVMQFGFSSFGTFAAGLIAQEYGVQWAVGSFAGLLVILSIIALIFLPRLRKLD